MTKKSSPSCAISAPVHLTRGYFGFGGSPTTALLVLGVVATASTRRRRRRRRLRGVRSSKPPLELPLLELPLGEEDGGDGDNDDKPCLAIVVYLPRAIVPYVDDEESSYDDLAIVPYAPRSIVPFKVVGDDDLAIVPYAPRLIVPFKVVDDSLAIVPYVPYVPRSIVPIKVVDDDDLAIVPYVPYVPRSIVPFKVVDDSLAIVPYVGAAVDAPVDAPVVQISILQIIADFVLRSAPSAIIPYTGGVDGLIRVMSKKYSPLDLMVTNKICINWKERSLVPYSVGSREEYAIVPYTGAASFLLPNTVGSCEEYAIVPYTGAAPVIIGGFGVDRPTSVSSVGSREEYAIVPYTGAAPVIIGGFGVDVSKRTIGFETTKNCWNDLSNLVGDVCVSTIISFDIPSLPKMGVASIAPSVASIAPSNRPRQPEVEESNCPEDVATVDRAVVKVPRAVFKVPKAKRFSSLQIADMIEKFSALSIVDCTIKVPVNTDEDIIDDKGSDLQIADLIEKFSALSIDDCTIKVPVNTDEDIIDEKGSEVVSRAENTSDGDIIDGEGSGRSLKSLTIIFPELVPTAENTSIRIDADGDIVDDERSSMSLARVKAPEVSVKTSGKVSHSLLSKFRPRPKLQPVGKFRPRPKPVGLGGGMIPKTRSVSFHPSVCFTGVHERTGPHSESLARIPRTHRSVPRVFAPTNTPRAGSSIPGSIAPPSIPRTLHSVPGTVAPPPVVETDLEATALLMVPTELNENHTVMFPSLDENFVEQGLTGNLTGRRPSTKATPGSKREAVTPKPSPSSKPSRPTVLVDKNRKYWANKMFNRDPVVLSGKKRRVEAMSMLEGVEIVPFAKSSYPRTGDYNPSWLQEAKAKLREESKARAMAYVAGASFL